MAAVTKSVVERAQVLTTNQKSTNVIVKPSGIKNSADRLREI